MKSLPVIAIRYPVWSRYWVTVMPGVLDHIRLHGAWRLQTENNSYGEMEAIRIDQSWVGDGAILFRATEAELESYRRRGQAVVITCTEGPDFGYPRVVPDNIGVGRMAALHLLEKGLQQFAYLARGETLYREATFAPGFRLYSRQRLKGFAAELAGHGVKPVVHMLEGRALWLTDSWRRIQDEVCGFLRALPLPCGLFVADDALAAVVMRAAEEIGLEVPKQLAVVGFGDDPMYCMAGHPAVSSVPYPGVEIGRLAAELLARQLAGEECRDVVMEVPVKEVVARGSTDTIAIPDEVVAMAMAWIQRHAALRPVAVTELEDACGLSSSALTQKFRRVLGSSPKKEITRVRLKHLKSLLLTTKASVADIAKAMQFASAHELSRFYLNETGERPTVFREREANGEGR